MAVSPRIVLMVAALVSLPAEASECLQPVYRGIKSGTLMKFLGETGPAVFKEHGVIETRSPRRVFEFETTHSNGFSREYILLNETSGVHEVDSVLMRKQRDFTSVEGPADYIITPDLPSKFYYATNQAGQEALHALSLDDTWKRVSCGNGR